MVEGALAIIKIGKETRFSVYRGRYSEFYGKKEAINTKSFAGRDPFVFTEQRKDGSWVTRHYFFEKEDFGFDIEWLT